MIFGWLLAFLFLGIIGVGVALIASSKSNRKSNKGKLVVGIISSIIGLLLFITIPFSFQQVETGEVAVVKELGEVKDVREAGVHFDFWMTRSYIKYDTIYFVFVF